MTVDFQSLVFWTLLHLWSTPSLAEQIRHETAAFAIAFAASAGFEIPEPRLKKLNVEELSRSCPEEEQL